MGSGPCSEGPKAPMLQGQAVGRSGAGVAAVRASIAAKITGLERNMECPATLVASVGLVPSRFVA
jgi:hypothetical protein